LTAFFSISYTGREIKTTAGTRIEDPSFHLCWSRQGDHKVEPKISVYISARGDR